ncbi:MAG TPA: YncE family protein [Chthonomonadaceae bacterium]|nr:YncE family protein [Chthonomonadaceae bacterium]
MRSPYLLLLTALLLTANPGQPGVLLSARPPVLKKVADIPLPGGATRFDYQSFDPQTGRLYLSHMGDGRLVVFDTKTNQVIANLPGFPSITGVLFVPELNRVYASAAGSHEVVAVDAGHLKILARISGARFPDGLAYSPDEGKVFVSDESGGADLVIDARANRRLDRIPLGGEAGNTHYDPVSHRIFVAVQTRNEMAAIDPKTDRIVARYPLPGSDFPHGFTMDSLHRLMFVSCEGNGYFLRRQGPRCSGV